MKKMILFAAALFSFMQMDATPVNNNVKLDSAVIRKMTADYCTHYLTPKRNLRSSEYLEEMRLTSDYQADDWRANWFLGVQGGVSAFSGNPMGCADLFDRLSPNIHVYGGKWFTPSIGARLNYQGYQIKSCCFQKQDIASFHADLMYNIMAYRYGKGYEQKVDIIPYLGCGVIRNSTLRYNPFTLNYGIQTRYHLNDRLHLTAEFSGLLTSQTFDGAGKPDRLGDNKLDFSVGLAVNIGKLGFNARSLKTKVIQSDSRYMPSHPAWREQESKVSIETVADNEEKDKYPVNNYSGLNSLRSRMAIKGHNDANNRDKTNGGAKTHRNNDSMCACGHDGCTCGSDGCARNNNCQNEAATEAFDSTKPYFCYFKLNSHELTSEVQLEALKEIVAYAQGNGKTIHLTGAVDSATGTAQINQTLSEDRAGYITQQLMSLGMDVENIKVTTLGGISKYNPNWKNRMVKIEFIPN